TLADKHATGARSHGEYSADPGASAPVAGVRENCGKTPDPPPAPAIAESPRGSPAPEGAGSAQNTGGSRHSVDRPVLPNRDSAPTPAQPARRSAPPALQHRTAAIP